MFRSHLIFVQKLATSQKKKSYSINHEPKKVNVSDKNTNNSKNRIRTSQFLRLHRHEGKKISFPSIRSHALRFPLVIQTLTFLIKLLQ